MKRTETVAMLAVLAPIALVGGLLAPQQVERFQVVSGHSYEGAIIPAPLVPDWYKDVGVTSTWTPTESDVALTKRGWSATSSWPLRICHGYPRAPSSACLSPRTPWKGFANSSGNCRRTNASTSVSHQATAAAF
jgi:hypothetical protein